MPVTPYVPNTPPALDSNPRQLAVWAFQNAWYVANDKANAATTYFNDAISGADYVPTDPSISPANTITQEELDSIASITPYQAPTHDAYVPPTPSGPLITQAELDRLASVNQHQHTAHPVVQPNPIGPAPAVIKPIVNIPVDAERATTETFEVLAQAIIDKLSKLYADWISTYAPSEAYYTNAGNWLETAILGGTGIAPHVEAQIWDRDRSRVLREADRAEAEALQSWAARGYSLPPGAAVHQVSVIRKEAGDRIAQASRDVAIKQAEIEIENVRFAVKTAIDARTAFLAAAADYIKALSVGQTAALQVIPSITDSQARLISAAADMYRADISFYDSFQREKMQAAEHVQQFNIKSGDWDIASEETRARFISANSDAVRARVSVADLSLRERMQTAEHVHQAYLKAGDWDVASEETKVRFLSANADTIRAKVSVAELSLREPMQLAEHVQQLRTKTGDWDSAALIARTNAAVAAAQSVGTQAAAALNSLHVAVGASNSTQDSVSYNYSNDTTSAPPSITLVV